MMENMVDIFDDDNNVNSRWMRKMSLSLVFDFRKWCVDNIFEELMDFV